MELTKEQKIHFLQLCLNFTRGTGQEAGSPHKKVRKAIPEVKEWNFKGITEALDILDLEQRYQDIMDEEYRTEKVYANLSPEEAGIDTKETN